MVWRAFLHSLVKVDYSQSFTYYIQLTDLVVHVAYLGYHGSLDLASVAYMWSTTEVNQWATPTSGHGKYQYDSKTCMYL